MTVGYVPIFPCIEQGFLLGRDTGPCCHIGMVHGVTDISPWYIVSAVAIDSTITCGYEARVSRALFPMHIRRGSWRFIERLPDPFLFRWVGQSC
jgi:hypothetical protein